MKLTRRGKLGLNNPKWTRRLSSSTKNSTYKRRSDSVSTVKKSQASIVAACWRRNCRQLGPDRRRPGPSWLASRMRLTVVDETRRPSFSSSPAMRG
jgi:hypothetical protein